MRLFFDSLARKHQFDPLVPENWYPFVEDVVISEKVIVVHVVSPPHMRWVVTNVSR